MEAHDKSSQRSEDHNLDFDVHVSESGVLGWIKEIESLASKKLHFNSLFEICLTAVFADESCTLFV